MTTWHVTLKVQGHSTFSDSLIVSGKTLAFSKFKALPATVKKKCTCDIACRLLLITITVQSYVL